VLGLRTTVTIAFTVAAGCAASPERAPVARIATTPTAIPQGDGQQTPVMIDGSTSADIDDPGATLTFHWTLLDDTATIDGADDTPMIVARFAGERPPTIVLDVTVDGDTGELEYQLQLTLP
jgi:hypothetical protein